MSLFALLVLHVKNYYDNNNNDGKLEGLVWYLLIICL